MKRPIALIGAPCGVGAPRPGADGGPKALRAAGLVTRLRRGETAAAAEGEIRVEVTDQGDVDVAPVAGLALPGMRQAGAVAGWARAVHAACAAAFGSGRLPVTLGGDHAVAMGSLIAAAEASRRARAPLFVLWIDAHGDFNTPLISPSGAAHGMSMAFACGEPGFDGLMAPAPTAFVDPHHVLMMDARALDRPEAALMAARGVRVTGGDLDDAATAFFAEVDAAGGRLHVSLDLDVIDPRTAPGVTVPEEGGRAPEAVARLLRAAARSGRLASADVVELNPIADPTGRSGALLVDLAAALLRPD